MPTTARMGQGRGLGPGHQARCAAHCRSSRKTSRCMRAAQGRIGRAAALVAAPALAAPLPPEQLTSLPPAAWEKIYILPPPHLCHHKCPNQATSLTSQASVRILSLPLCHFSNTSTAGQTDCATISARCKLWGLLHISNVAGHQVPNA